MPKAIVLCCDGTANEFSKDRTNVAKLFYTLRKGAPSQACFYHPGIGTMAPPGFVTKGGAHIAELLGLVLGYGLTNDIRDAYVFLADTFEPGDRVFLFGFSRGAYTVRALTSLLKLYGMIQPGNAAFVPYMVRMLWRIRSLRAGGRAATSAYFQLADDFKATFSIECRPHFVGVWDTVSSVGWFTSPVALPYTANNADIAVGRHAVSIDECRAFFRPNLWVPREPNPGPRDLRQVWFPGVHSDVGGGYPEAQSGLSKVALEWMIMEARAAGLLTQDDVVDLILGRRGDYAAPDPKACLHDSMSGWWSLVESLPKPHWDARTKSREWRANQGRPRSFPEAPVIHDAAWARGADYAARLPRHAIRLSDAETRGVVSEQFGVLL